MFPQLDQILDQSLPAKNNAIFKLHKDIIEEKSRIFNAYFDVFKMEFQDAIKW